MNVLLIGHACGPGMGSEPGFTWNWAQQLARRHRVWVVAHPEFRSGVEEWMRRNPNPRLTFVWVSVESRLDPWRPGQSERGIKIHYLLWLSKAYAVARELCRTAEIDIAQHVSWGTLAAAPRIWRLPAPTVWGPVGGGQTAPLGFLRYFGRRGWQEIVRSCSVYALRFSPGLRKAARGAAVVLATNRETEELLERVAPGKAQRFLDCGLPAEWAPPALSAGRRTGGTRPGEQSDAGLTLLWAGRLEHRKALRLALEALARVRTVAVRLLVAGAGALRPELEALAARLGVASRVEFLGAVPYGGMPALFQSADAFLFTSLRDSFGSVVLEAMAQGLPIVCLDHQGVGAFVPEGAGIKVPVTTPRRTVAGLAAAMETLRRSAALRHRMGLTSREFAETQTWERRAEQMSRIYEQVVASHPRPARLRKNSALDAATIGAE